MTNLSGLQFNVNYMSIKITFSVLATGCRISAAIVAQTRLTGPSPASLQVYRTAEGMNLK